MKTKLDLHGCHFQSNRSSRNLCYKPVVIYIAHLRRLFSLELESLLVGFVGFRLIRKFFLVSDFILLNFSPLYKYINSYRNEIMDEWMDWIVWVNVPHSQANTKVSIGVLRQWFWWWVECVELNPYSLFYGNTKWIIPSHGI